ncbi:MAG TPA: hypothetical protein VIL09_08455 [Microvirga sp.]|jgi:hypothetical protein
MPQVIAALFQDAATAQQALQAMMQAGVTRDRVTVIGENEGRNVSSISGFRELSARDDLLAELHDLPLPDDDLQLFGQGLQHGCVLISARVDRENMEEAIRVIEMFDPVDLDRRSEEWMSGRGAGGAQSGVDMGAPLGAGITGGMNTGNSNLQAIPGMTAMADDPSVLGTSDLQTGEASLSDQGRSTLPVEGDRRADERAGAPGTLELDQRADAALATKMASGTGAFASGSGNAKPDLYRRETNRLGRVRAYSRD